MGGRRGEGEGESEQESEGEGYSINIFLDLLISNKSEKGMNRSFDVIIDNDAIE